MKNFTQLHQQFMSELNDIDPSLSPLMRSMVAHLMVMERQKGREEQYHEDLTAMRQYVPDVGDRLMFRSETDPWELRESSWRPPSTGTYNDDIDEVFGPLMKGLVNS